MLSSNSDRTRVPESVVLQDLSHGSAHEREFRSTPKTFRPKPAESSYRKWARRAEYTAMLLPALFIFAMIAFVGFCTLGVVVPWRIGDELSRGKLPIVTILGALLFLAAFCNVSVSFWRCVATSNAVADNRPHDEVDVVESFCQICQWCHDLKPARSHHCSICRKCTLKMDHHCPWVSNCVGYYNYKYFCLFLWSTCVGCHVATVLCANDILARVFPNWLTAAGRYRGAFEGWVMICSLLTLAFGVTLLFFGAMHLNMVFQGCTTIEFGGAQRYSRGFRKNFTDIFGERWQTWFLPVQTVTGDGYEFNNRHMYQTRLSMDSATDSDSHSDPSIVDDSDYQIDTSDID